MIPLFPGVMLSCLYKTESEKPRIEWKKIANGDPNFVYFDGKFMGMSFVFAFLLFPCTKHYRLILLSDVVHLWFSCLTNGWLYLSLKEWESLL